MLRKSMEDIKKIQLKFLEMKSTIPDMKYTIYGIKRLGTTEQRLMNLA